MQSKKRVALGFSLWSSLAFPPNPISYVRTERSQPMRTQNATKLILAGGLAVAALLAQSPQPTCRRCQATYIPVSELTAYTAKAVKYNIVDQQVRSVDLGK